MSEGSTSASWNRAGPDRGRERIEHVIVLMMENRSFDHVLGYLDHSDPDYPSLNRVQASCPLNPAKPNADLVQTSPTASQILGTDPDHSYESAMLQLFGRRGGRGSVSPTMSGFIRAYGYRIRGISMRPANFLTRAFHSIQREWSGVWRWITRKHPPVRPDPRDIMKCFAEHETPVLSHLAKEFAVLVDWHASVPGETWPNRNYAHAATSDGAANIELRFYDDTTIFEQLGQAGRDWGIYQDGIAQVWAFWKLWANGTHRFHSTDALLIQIEADELPAYAFVEPNHGYGKGQGNSQHPCNNLTTGDSFVAGEALMATIFNALVDKPDVFAKTLLLITYDEHGGFFDHVAPQDVPAPDAKQSESGFDFTISGVRVPAVAISPLIPKGTIDKRFYDHASIPKSVRNQFTSGLQWLTERDRAANDFIEGLGLLPTPRTDVQRINVPMQAGVGEAAMVHTLNDFEASLLELAGAVKTELERPARRESFATPPFVPDLALKVAADTRVMIPGSPASAAVDEVVAWFIAPAESIDAPDIELGPEPNGG